MRLLQQYVNWQAFHRLHRYVVCNNRQASQQLSDGYYLFHSKPEFGVFQLRKLCR